MYPIYARNFRKRKAQSDQSPANLAEVLVYATVWVRPWADTTLMTQTVDGARHLCQTAGAARGGTYGSGRNRGQAGTEALPDVQQYRQGVLGN